MDGATAVNSLIALGTLLIAGAGVAISLGTNRRAQYDRVLTETAKLTTGEVAEARHRAGFFMESMGDRQMNQAEVEAMYTVIWTFERLNGLFESLSRPGGRARRLSRPQKLLLTTARSAIHTWHSYINRDLFDEHGTRLDFSPSGDGLRNLWRRSDFLGS